MTDKTTGSMRYVKMFVSECLEGTVRFDLDPAERSVWYDLVILAGRMRIKGLIAARPGTPYPHTWIAGVLNIPLELLDRSLEILIKTERICENDDGIHILNWSKYQSEYDRQKPYREAKKLSINTNIKRCPKCNQVQQACTCEGSPLREKLDQDKGE